MEVGRVVMDVMRSPHPHVAVTHGYVAVIVVVGRRRMGRWHIRVPVIVGIHRVDCAGGQFAGQIVHFLQQNNETSVGTIQITILVEVRARTDLFQVCQVLRMDRIKPKGH